MENDVILGGGEWKKKARKAENNIARYSKKTSSDDTRMNEIEKSYKGCRQESNMTRWHNLKV